METSDFWNFIELPTPVILSSPLTCGHANEVVSHLKLLMNKIQNTMNDFNQLSLEAATLSRLIYKIKHKLRQEKSFKVLQKINRCLTNYLTMNLPFTLSSIRDTLNLNLGPTRQMMEWALVRLYGTAQLFHRVYSLCLDAAGHLFVRIKLSHLWDLTFFSVATVSRIWTYSQFIVRSACEWYSSLHQFLDRLPSSPSPWLPPGCNLPHDLVQTLDNPQYLRAKSVYKPSKILSQLNIPLPEADRAQLTNTMSAVINIDMMDDIGESVMRDVFEENRNKRHNQANLHSKQKNYKKDEKQSEMILSHKTNLQSKQKNHRKDDTQGIQSEKIHSSKAYLQSKQNNHLKDDKQGMQSEKPPISKGTYKHSIKNIKSSIDLERFIQIETNCREAVSETTVIHQSVMKNIDKLQWSIMKKMLAKQLKIIRKSEKSGALKQQEKLLNNVQNIIKQWIHLLWFLLFHQI